MTEQIKKTLRDSKAARWTALVIVSFTMMWGYFLTDAMSPLMTMLEVEVDELCLGPIGLAHGAAANNHRYDGITRP